MKYRLCMLSLLASFPLLANQVLPPADYMIIAQDHLEEVKTRQIDDAFEDEDDDFGDLIAQEAESSEVPEIKPPSSFLVLLSSIHGKFLDLWRRMSKWWDKSDGRPVSAR